MIEILYEDTQILVFNKLPGVAVQSRDDDMMDTIFKNYHLITRLDQPVSGACILAKTKESAKLFSELLRQTKIKKSYIAIVEGHPKQMESNLTNKIIKKGYKAFVDNKKGKQAKLRYLIVESLENYSVLFVEIFTGRFHQIRVQLGNIGHCIKGDLKYGARRSNKHPGIYLHCRKIAFVHPISNKKIKICANFPEYGLWSVINKDI